MCMQFCTIMIFLLTLIARRQLVLTCDRLASLLALSKPHPYIIVTIKLFRSEILNPKSNQFVVGSGDGVPAVQITPIITRVWWRFDQLLNVCFSCKAFFATNVNCAKQ